MDRHSARDSKKKWRNHPPLFRTNLTGQSNGQGDFGAEIRGPAEGVINGISSSDGIIDGTEDCGAEIVRDFGAEISVAGILVAGIFKDLALKTDKEETNNPAS